MATERQKEQSVKGGTQSSEIGEFRKRDGASLKAVRTRGRGE